MKNLILARRDFRTALWRMAVFSFFVNILLLVMPLYMLQIYDRVLPSQSNDTLLFLSLIAIFALVVMGILEMVRSVLANRAASNLETVLGDDVLSMSILAGTRTNGSIQPLRDLQTIRGVISSRLAFAVLDLPFSFLFSAVLYIIHPDLFWIVVGGALVLAALAFFGQILVAKPTAQNVESTIRSNHRAEYLARNSDSLRAMGMMKNSVALWGEEYARSLVAGDRAAVISGIMGGISKAFRMGLQIGILGYGAILVLDGEITAGMIFASSIISSRALQPIDQVINSWRQLAAGWLSWQRLSSDLEKFQIRDRFTPLPEPAANIVARDLYYANPVNLANPPIVMGISFQINAGEIVAIVGPSGAGKSTLARILVGALVPQRGVVRIDGHDIANWDPEELGKHIGYLSQDVELLPGTVGQNISRFIPDAREEEIWAASEMAHAQELIQRLPNAYDTPISTGISQISGGEKQRIGLARAFFGNPKILVLDEPNSSLDAAGTRALVMALAAAKKKGIAVLLITQRTEVIQFVDKIMQIVDGSLKLFGPRDSVLKKLREEAQNNESKPPSKPAPATNTGKKPVPAFPVSRGFQTSRRKREKALKLSRADNNGSSMTTPKQKESDE